MSSGIHTNLAGRSDKAPWDRFKRPDKPVAEYTSAEVFEECINLAEVYLNHRGYEVLQRSWTGQRGNADLIAQNEKGVLILVSVSGMLRPNASLVSMPELEDITSFTEKVRPVLKECAQAYNVKSAQVDVIAVCIRGERMAQIRHFANTAQWKQNR